MEPSLASFIQIQSDPSLIYVPQYFEALMTHHIPSDYISLQIQFFTNSFTQKIFIILPHAGFILGNTFTLEIKTGRKDK